MAKRITSKLSLDAYVELLSFLLRLTESEKDMLKVIITFHKEGVIVTNASIREKMGLRTQSVSKRLAILKAKKAINADYSLTDYTDFNNQLLFSCQFT